MAGIYLNTDMASLVGATQLRQTNAAMTNSMLQQATGMRINYAMDDPAGLVASETLRSEIAGIEAAKSNTDRAISMFKVADKGLEQINSKLETASNLILKISNPSTGADEIAASNAELSKLKESITRDISSTSYMGNNLLDDTLAGAKKFQIGTDAANGQVSFTFKDVGEGAKLKALLDGITGTLDSAGALALVDTAKGASTEVAAYRGDVGGFQKHILEANNKALDARLNETVGAEADIRNMDAAKLASDMAKNQLLMQTGISTLLQAGQNRAYAGALLG